MVMAIFRLYLCLVEGKLGIKIKENNQKAKIYGITGNSIKLNKSYLRSDGYR